MPATPITLHKIKVRLLPALAEPVFGVPPVLSGDPWDFVALWLRRERMTEAGFYWTQARAFYEATVLLPKTSAPLAAYYCFLNAAKALLVARKIPFTDRHGVSGYQLPGNVTLSNEITILHTGGVMPKLAEAFGERVSVKEPHSLDALLYSVPFVHRAYQLTYPSAPELFLPLRENCFVRKNGSKETWLAARVPSRYLSAHFARVLPRGWERDLGSNDKVVVRRKTRFDWNGRQLRDSMPRLVSYHARTRRDVVPIYSNWTRWYLRRNVADPRAIRRAPVILAFAAMHRLSELTRYFPQRLARHFDGRQNWLLAEFLSMAPAQFVFAIASELTGREFIRPDSYSTGPSRNG